MRIHTDAHSMIPETVSSSDSLPETLSASLKTKQAGYRLSESQDSDVESSNGETKTESRDVLLERYLGLLDEYFACQKRISDNIGSGHFHLSKARMQLGRLTTMNQGWDARMKTTWAVRVQQGGSILLKRVKPGDDNEAGEEEGVLIEEKGESSLRQRKGALVIKDVRLSEKEGTEQEKEKEKRKKKGQPFDALYQFAALPPPSLRQAQSTFSNALIGLINGERGTKSLLQIQSDLRHLEGMLEEKA